MTFNLYLLIDTYVYIFVVLYGKQQDRLKFYLSQLPAVPHLKRSASLVDSL